MIFNGELYNHLDLRDNLTFTAWRGHSDSETLVEGLAQDGLGFLSKVCGMFAFAAYDLQSNELLLCRDRFGIKPLYIVSQPDGISFSSEQRALPVQQRLNPHQVSDVLSFGHVSASSQIDKLSIPCLRPLSIPAATVVRISKHGLTHSFCYWHLQSQSRSKHSSPPASSIKNISQASALLRNQINSIVSQHLLSDVPVACFLSSGLDSGILAALACRHLPGAISTFTVALPGSPHDEGVMSRKMARHCGSSHHELTIEQDQALFWVERALVTLDIPSADAINTFIISKAVASQGIKVALSGLGADELFGGYPSHRVVPLLRFLKFLPRQTRNTLLSVFTPRIARKLFDVEQWDEWHLSVALRRWASNSDLREAGVTPYHWPTPPSHGSLDTWGICTLAELYGYTEPMLLRDADAMSMACGLELRVPFLDHRLVEFVVLTCRRFQRPGKFLLRAACSDLFPPGYLNRRKQGFALPMRPWMLGPLQALCHTRLQSLRGSGLLDPLWIDQQWSSFEAGHISWPRAWSLVVLGEFALRDS
jgi:asparagine synthase (glutamine-hydrolysing)